MSYSDVDTMLALVFDGFSEARDEFNPGCGFDFLKRWHAIC